MEIECAIKVGQSFPAAPLPECGGDNVAYVQYMLGRQEPWKVRCFDCKYTVDRQAACKHDAQAHWNKEGRA